ncbi:MAG: PD-(D/E)XK nuclease family protein [Bacteroidales bacterium]|nr:PD-(D/E)XK nuclease family protein [Bacteroidales bacterium]
MSKEQQDITAAQILQFAEDYCQKLDEVKENQPYHLNIIEELHINENAHSRILAKLLQYKDKKGKYVFLESLLEFINDKKGYSCDFSKINIVSTEITQEKDRIDILILNKKDNAIIIENKICGAKDQEKQLSRYIKKVEGKEIQKRNIYIVYLTKYYQGPSNDTWSSVREKSAFSNRFLNLSYMCDILPWLYELIKNLDGKEYYIKSAIEQYINYLQILKKDRTMTKEMEDYLKKRYKGDLKTIIKEQNSIRELNEGLEEYKMQIIQKKIDKFVKDNKIECLEDEELLTISITINECNYFLYIRLESNNDIKCCLERYNPAEQNITEAVVERLKVFKLDGDNSQKYKIWNIKTNSNAVDNALKLFLDIKKALEKKK